jgi:hypothetical protein
MKRPVDTTYCSECGEPCQGQFIDAGIGAYECHGYRGVDVQWFFASECCESEVYLNGEYYEPERNTDY